MTLFVLKYLFESASDEYGDFSGWTDHRGFVIRAADQASARTIAAKHSEGKWWLNEFRTSCAPVSEDGDDEIILINMPTG